MRIARGEIVESSISKPFLMEVRVTREDFEVLLFDEFGGLKEKWKVLRENATEGDIVAFLCERGFSLSSKLYWI